MILITGGHGNLANSLKEYVDGDYYGKDMLDLTDRNCIRNLPDYEILIWLSANNISTIYYKILQLTYY